MRRQLDAREPYPYSEKQPIADQIDWKDIQETYMKLISIGPTFGELQKYEPRTNMYLDEVSKLCVDTMQPSGLEYLIAYWWENEDDTPQMDNWISLAPEGSNAGVRLCHPIKGDDLFNLFRRSIDPNDAFYTGIKCATSCRQFTSDWDGGAHLCLRHDDPTLEHTELLKMYTSSEDLTLTDWQDGMCPDFPGRLG